MMDPHAYAAIFILGAGGVALWIDQRFRGRTPEAMWTLVVHVLFALFTVRLWPSAGGKIVGAVGVAALELATLFAFIFPALVYFFVVAIWMIRFAQSGLAGRYR